MTVVEGQEMPAFFAGHSRVLLAHCGCLAVKADDNRVSAKGTATFVRAGSDRLIFTADHVVAALENARPEAIVLMLPSVTAEGEFEVGVLSPPAQLAVDLSVRWRSTEYDAALLDAAFVPDGSVRWFPIESSVRTCSTVRAVWRTIVDENGSLPFSIGGYAEWGHLRDHDARVEILSALPLFAYITEWDDGHGSKAPQIYLDIEAGPSLSKEAESDLHLLMAEQMETAAYPLGGYSGGPLALFDPKGVHLIGIVKEGGFMYGHARGFCSAVDDIARLAGI